MVQKIERIVMSFPPAPATSFDISYFIRDTVTGTLSVEQIADVVKADIDTPLKVGDILVGNFPSIDLPTTA